MQLELDNLVAVLRRHGPSTRTDAALWLRSLADLVTTNRPQSLVLQVLAERQPRARTCTTEISAFRNAFQSAVLDGKAAALLQSAADLLSPPLEGPLPAPSALMTGESSPKEDRKKKKDVRKPAIKRPRKKR